MITPGVLRGQPAPVAPFPRWATLYELMDRDTPYGHPFSSATTIALWPNAGAATGGGTGFTGWAYGYPLWTNVPVRWTSLALSVNTASASQSIYVAIGTYKKNSEILERFTFDAASTGIKTATCSFQPPIGLSMFWITASNTTAKWWVSSQPTSLFHGVLDPANGYQIETVGIRSEVDYSAGFTASTIRSNGVGNTGVPRIGVTWERC